MGINDQLRQMVSIAKGDQGVLDNAIEKAKKKNYKPFLEKVKKISKKVHGVLSSAYDTGKFLGSTKSLRGEYDKLRKTFESMKDIPTRVSNEINFELNSIYSFITELASIKTKKGSLAESNDIAKGIIGRMGRKIKSAYKAIPTHSRRVLVGGGAVIGAGGATAAGIGIHIRRKRKKRVDEAEEVARRGRKRFAGGGKGWEVDLRGMSAEEQKRVMRAGKRS